MVLSSYLTQIPNIKNLLKELIQDHPFGSTGFILMSLIFTLLTIFDSTTHDLKKLHQVHQNQIQIIQQWSFYQQEESHQSPNFLLFKQHQKFPLWNRSKIKSALEQMVMAHYLHLRFFDIVNYTSSGATSSDSFSSSENLISVHLNVGSIQEGPLFHLIELMVTNLQPWTQIRHILIQRCGNVDENMLKELKNKNQLDIIEARFELDWLLSLDSTSTPSSRIHSAPPSGGRTNNK